MKISVVFSGSRRAKHLNAIFGIAFSNFGYPEKLIFENESMWFKRNKNICVKRCYYKLLRNISPELLVKQRDSKINWHTILEGSRKFSRGM